MVDYNINPRSTHTKLIQLDVHREINRNIYIKKGMFVVLLIYLTGRLTVTITTITVS